MHNLTSIPYYYRPTAIRVMGQIASISTVEDGAAYRQVNLIDKGEPCEMAAGTQNDRDQSMQRRIESLKVI